MNTNIEPLRLSTLSLEPGDVVERFATPDSSNGVSIAAPHHLHQQWTEGKIGKDQLRSAIVDVWSRTEFPCRALRHRNWIKMFKSVGFLSDGGRERPTTPLKIWRGCLRGDRPIGLSWTTDQGVAEYFYERNSRDFPLRATLLHRAVLPWGVLALVDQRDESEVVIDPRALRGWCSHG